MNKKVKSGIFMAAIAVVFYIIGGLVGWPSSSNGLLGDVGKAKKYNKSVVTIDADALQEKMQADSVYRNEMLAAAGTMQIHADQFCALLEVSQQACADKKEFAKSLAAFEQVKQTALNAQEAIGQFVSDMNDLSQGKKVRGFEQDYNNAVLAFNMLQKCSSTAQQFVTDADQLLQQDLSADQQTLAALRNDWSLYMMATYVMNGDKLQLRACETLGFYFQDGAQLSSFRVDALFNSEQLAGQAGPQILSESAVLLSLLDPEYGYNLLGIKNERVRNGMTLESAFANGSLLNNLMFSQALLHANPNMLNSPLMIHFLSQFKIANEQALKVIEPYNAVFPSNQALFKAIYGMKNSNEQLGFRIPDYTWNEAELKSTYVANQSDNQLGNFDFMPFPRNNEVFAPFLGYSF